jgi:hypothetical protein
MISRTVFVTQRRACGSLGSPLAKRMTKNQLCRIPVPARDHSASGHRAHRPITICAFYELSMSEMGQEQTSEVAASDVGFPPIVLKNRRGRRRE